MEEKYGAKLGEAKPLPLANSGVLMVAIVLIIAGAGVMGYSISNDFILSTALLFHSMN